MSYFATCWCCGTGEGMFDRAPRIKLTEHQHICTRCFYALLNTPAVDRVLKKEASALRTRFLEEVY